MSDPVETAIEAVAEGRVISIPLPVVASVVSLATYGGYDLTKKTVGKVKQIRADRAAKKALKESLKEQTPQA